MKAEKVWLYSWNFDLKNQNILSRKFEANTCTYQADEYYLHQFGEGSDLSPSRENHGSYIRLDPVMSAMSHFKFGLQLNIEVHQMPR